MCLVCERARLCVVTSLRDADARITHVTLRHSLLANRPVHNLSCHSQLRWWLCVTIAVLARLALHWRRLYAGVLSERVSERVVVDD